MSVKNHGRLFVVANAGRSGSTFLWNLLQSNNAAKTIFHEDIPVQVSQPRVFNRAYATHECAHVAADRNLGEYLDRWGDLLKEGDVVETGWTVYHLLPILHHFFQERLYLVILHRDPWSVALSRANMGNYHPNTWYDDRHEVSPNDPNSIAPEYATRWLGMNHAEKCLYWWYVIYKEIDEFIDRNDSVSRIEISAHSLFQGNGVGRISEFLGASLDAAPNLERNPVQRFMRETFPVFDEHLAFAHHDEINDYAKRRFGYELNVPQLDHQAQKYRLPQEVMPRLRYATNYWSHRRRAGQSIRSLIGRGD